MVFLFGTCAAYSINGNTSSMYLTDELAFSKESLSLVKIVSAPSNIIVSFLSGWFSQKKPFRFLFWITVSMIITNSYAILIMLNYFPKDKEEQLSTMNIAHVTAVTLINDCLGNFWFVTAFAIVARIIDIRVAGIHITLLASLTNQASFVHKFYIFKLVDKYSIFYPQAALGAMSLLLCVVLREDLFRMDDVPKENWLVRDSVILGS